VSGPDAAGSERRDPLLADGILAPSPVLEWHGHALVARLGGTAITPWRGHALAAAAAGVAWARDSTGLHADQAIVHLGKGQAAVHADLAAAWAAIAPGGRLVVGGPNVLGAATWIDRIAAILGPPLAAEARAKRRAAAFLRDDRPAPWSVDVRATLFAGGAIDPGTALLIHTLDGVADPGLVVDVGAGAGHLADAARHLWPRARCVLVDADARAVAWLADAGWPETHWWDAGEPLPVTGAGLALCNPPCHAGAENDLAVGTRMAGASWTALAPGGRLRLVVNRQLPYEAILTGLGRPERIAGNARYKVLEVIRA
jgi:16S rRNA (guanine1207-N2)-methyltransferase